MTVVEWKHIGSAPKDGTHILFTRTNPWSPNDIIIGYWHTSHNEFVEKGSLLQIVPEIWAYWAELPQLAETMPNEQEKKTETQKSRPTCASCASCGMLVDAFSVIQEETEGADTPYSYLQCPHCGKMVPGSIVWG